MSLAICKATSKISTVRTAPVHARRPMSVKAVHQSTGGTAVDSLARGTTPESAMRALELCEAQMSRQILLARKTLRPTATSATHGTATLDVCDEEEEEVNPMDTLCICSYDEDDA